MIDSINDPTVRLMAAIGVLVLPWAIGLVSMLRGR